MTTKTKTTKTTAAKNENAVLPSAIALSAYTDAVASLNEKLALLQSADVIDVDAVRATKNHATRAAEFAAALNNEAFAKAWDSFAESAGLTAAKVQAMQIYAQDKMLATLKAIAAGCALSSVRAGNHSNMMTQRLVHVLTDKGEVTVANAPRYMHDAFSDKSMGTYSAQATSSRQVLDTLGMLDWNVLTKAFKLNDKAEEYRHVIAH